MRTVRLDGSAGTEGPDPDAQYWTTADVARYLGVNLGTVSSYRGRHQMPEPHGRIGSTPVWKPETIIAWQAERPRSRRAQQGIDA